MGHHHHERATCYTDAYLSRFPTEIVAVDADAHAVALAATAFFPTGGGQPHDTGMLSVGGVDAMVIDVANGRDSIVWHTLAPESPLPEAGDAAVGQIDWERRHLLMRIHTAQHILNGVIWNDYSAHVTGASMTPGEGRLDFELPSMSQEFARAVEERVNLEVERGLPVAVLFLPRSEADRDPSLLRLKARGAARRRRPQDRGAERGVDVAQAAEASGGDDVAARAQRPWGRAERR